MMHGAPADHGPSRSPRTSHEHSPVPSSAEKGAQPHHGHHLPHSVADALHNMEARIQSAEGLVGAEAARDVKAMRVFVHRFRGVDVRIISF
jgi:hypothetical protein